MNKVISVFKKHWNKAVAVFCVVAIVFVTSFSMTSVASADDLSEVISDDLYDWLKDNLYSYGKENLDKYKASVLEFGFDLLRFDTYNVSGGNYSLPDGSKPSGTAYPITATCDGSFHTLAGTWDLIIGHPPCTYLTKAGACRMYSYGMIDSKRFNSAMAAKAFFFALYNADCSHIALENPVPMSMIGLPAYSQLIQPYQFGDPYSKKTCLWLKGLPPLMGTVICSDYVSWTSLSRSSKMRSKTFPGIAAAMAEQWTYYIDLCNRGDSFIADI